MLSITDIDICASTHFCKVMGKYGSDKGHDNIKSCWHNYTLIYHKLFNHLINNKLRIFELGLGTNNLDVPSNMGIYGIPGASHRGWKELFPNSLIYGADIDNRILFTDDRIETYYCDQRDPISINNLWNNVECLEDFDIIIDDGLHEFTANVTFFENSIHKLKSNGYYIIEDILFEHIKLFEDKMKEWEIQYLNLEFQLLIIPHLTNTNDNILMIIHNKN
jgi:hypothetical protein